MGHKAAFLDRDGVINLDRGYVAVWEDFEFLPGAVDALRALEAAGYRLIVVTNQSGIARGYYSEASFLALTARIEHALSVSGVHLTATYYCPHLADAPIGDYAIACECRKPAPGLLLRAASEWDIDLSRSFIVGDKPSDVEAGAAAGVPVRVFVARDADPVPAAATAVCASLADALTVLGIAPPLSVGP